MRGPLRLNDLADRMGTTAPTASRAVDALVELGLVERARRPGDRRAVQIDADARRARAGRGAQGARGRGVRAGRRRARRRRTASSSPRCSTRLADALSPRRASAVRVLQRRLAPLGLGQRQRRPLQTRR